MIAKGKSISYGAAMMDYAANRETSQLVAYNKLDLDFEKTFGLKPDNVWEQFKKEYQKFIFDLEHTRNKAVYDFNKELYSGWRFSYKVGMFLYLFNIITILIAIAYCCWK